MSCLHPISFLNEYRMTCGHYREVPSYRIERPRGMLDWLIIYSISDQGVFTHHEQTHVAPPHEVVLIRPGTPHTYGTAPGFKHWELLWAHFTHQPAWDSWLDWPELSSGFMAMSVRGRTSQRRIIDALTKANDIMSGYFRLREPLALNALESALIWCQENHPEQGRARLDPRIRQAVDHLCRHFHQPITLSDLARTCKLSPSWLSSLFHQQVGQTPMQFLEQRRIDRARQLLQFTSRPIREIAGEVGYDNPFYFTLRFKKITGVSPRAFRQRVMQPPT